MAFVSLMKPRGISRSLPSSTALWTPASLGANLKGWWKSDAGLFAQTAASFASASSESLSHTGNATLRGQSGTGGWWRAGWFKLTTLAATLYLNNVSAPGNDGYHTEINTSGVLQLRVGSGSGNTTLNRTGTAITTGQWYFVYVHYDGTNIGLSLDNETIQTAALATYSPGSGAFRLGSNNTPANFLNGLMQEWCGGDGSLTTGERDALYNSGAGITYESTTLTTKLLFWFKLHENSGTRTDAKGGLTLTDNNTVTNGDGKVQYATTTAGDLISKWADQSGSGNDLTQATFTKRPVYTADYFGTGRYGLVADGSDDALGNSLVLASVWSAGLVARNDGSAAGVRRFWTPRPATDSPAAMTDSAASTPFFGWYSNQAVGVTALAATKLKGRFILVRESDTVMRYRLDGSTTGTFDPSNNAPATGMAVLAGTGAGVQSFLGGVGEVIVVNAALSSTEELSMSGYLETRWS